MIASDCFQLAMKNFIIFYEPWMVIPFTRAPALTKTRSPLSGLTTDISHFYASLTQLSEQLSESERESCSNKIVLKFLSVFCIGFTSNNTPQNTLEMMSAVVATWFIISPTDAYRSIWLHTVRVEINALSTTMTIRNVAHEGFYRQVGLWDTLENCNHVGHPRKWCLTDPGLCAWFGNGLLFNRAPVTRNGEKLSFILFFVTVSR